MPDEVGDNIKDNSKNVFYVSHFFMGSIDNSNFLEYIYLMKFLIYLVGFLFLFPASALAYVPEHTESSGAQGCFIVAQTLREGLSNDVVEVAKLQYFLREHSAPSLEINGVFTPETTVAVKAFQEVFASDILVPWGYTSGTGVVYTLTKNKINEIVCGQKIPLTTAQQAEIAAFKASRDVFVIQDTEEVFAGGFVGEISSTSTALAMIESPTERVVTLTPESRYQPFVQTWRGLSASVYDIAHRDAVEYIVVVPFLLVVLAVLFMLVSSMVARKEHGVIPQSRSLTTATPTTLVDISKSNKNHD